jgi:hypothetical protein
MIDWSIAELILLDRTDEVNWDISPEVARRARLWQNAERAKIAARNGNPEQLKRLHPELSEFIHSPKRKQGQRKSYRPKCYVWTDIFREELLEMAIDDVRLLRRVIWPKHYDGRSKRRTAPSAEEIVAERYGLIADQIYDAIRARSRRVAKARARRRI